MSARRIVGREDGYDEPAAKRFSLHQAPSEDLKAEVAMKVERSINEDPFCFLSTVFLGAVPLTIRLNSVSIEFGGSQPRR